MIKSIMVDSNNLQEFFLVNPAFDLGFDQLDRYVLLMVPRGHDIYEVQGKIFYPHEKILLNGNEELAGTVVLDWLNEEGRNEDDAYVARAFFGWGTSDLSENQKLFIAEAKRQGVEVYDHVPENSFGQICPAITIDYNYSITLTADFEEDEYQDILFARY